MARAACDTVTQLWWVLKPGGRPQGVGVEGAGLDWWGNRGSGEADQQWLSGANV